MGTDKLDARVTPLHKGLGFLERALEPGEIADLGWNLLREDLSLPTAVLYRDKLLHNLSWMQQFITAYGVKLAPHRHPEEEILIISDGAGIIECAGKVTQVGPGAMMYCAGNTLHGITNTGSTQMTFYWSKWLAKGSA